MNERRVWVSKALPDPDLEQRVRTDIWLKDADTAIRAATLNENGSPVPPDICPQRIWGRDNAPQFAQLPHLFYAGSYLIVSAEAAAVLRRFDLGRGALYPVREGIYQKDNETRVPGEFFTWILGNVKEAFLEQFSPNIKPMAGSNARDWCMMPWDLADDDIAVSPSALEGPDIWVDPILFQSIFVSRALGDALDAAGLRKAFRLYRCRVV